MTSFLGGAIAGAGVLTQRNTRVQILDFKGDVVALFDASLSETYQTNVTVTEFPVEGGATIAEHLIRAPLELAFTGLVSDTPLGTQEALGTEAATGLVASVVPPLGVAAAGAAYGLYQAESGDPSKSRATWDKLRALQLGNPDPKSPQPPRPFTVKTKLGDFSNMVIKSLSTPRNPESGDGLEFHITFVQVTVVKAQTVSAAQFQNPGLAAGRQDLGDQTPDVDRFTPGKIAGNQAVGIDAATHLPFGG